jgi:predicted metalloprotease with PDZ domain
MRGWILVLAACSHGAAPKAPAAPPPDLEYTLRYVPGPAVEVTVECTAPASQITTFAVDKYADVDDPETSIRDVSARVVGGGELAVDARPPHAWRVRAPEGTRIALHYTIFSRHAPTMNDRFRTIVTPTFVHFIGTLALASPAHLGDDKLNIRFAWQGLGELHPATSFGTQQNVTVKDTLSHFLAGAFLAAPDLRATHRRVGDGEVEVAIVGKWKFADAQLADQIARIAAIERKFFDDSGAPYYFVSLWPLGKTGSYGGTGFTHSYDLVMTPDTELDHEIVGLLAHEYFHNWNGEMITPEAFEALTYWFTEGFTVFYGARLRYRAGVLTLAEYAREMSNDVRAYMTSPAKEVSNARAVAGFWTDEMGIGKVPYLRGNLVALVTDREIRRESDGHTSLDDVMHTLAFGHDPKITSERVLAMIEGLTSTAFAARLRATVIDGAPLAIPTDLFAPCLVGTTKTVWTFELGFDWPKTNETNVIAGVRAGSAAAKAGLHDGEKLHGISVQFEDSEKNVEIDVGDPTHHVSYMPRGHSVETVEFSPGDPKACAAILGPPI